MAIIWRKGMSVGNDIIDHDHHFMINFINTIELVLQKPEEKKMLLAVIEQLRDYAGKHFRREEAIQRRIQYPHSIHHKNEHTLLLKEIDNLILEIDATKSAEEIAKRSTDIIDILRNWLINHVLKEDMKLKPYLEILPRAFS